MHSGIRKIMTKLLTEKPQHGNKTRADYKDSKLNKIITDLKSTT